MRRSRGRINMPPTSPAPWSVTQWTGSNYTDLLTDPFDHAIGRSRGGWSTTVHDVVDGHGRPLVILIEPGQATDAPMFPLLMRHLRIRRPNRAGLAPAGSGPRRQGLLIQGDSRAPPRPQTSSR
jgi:hypothetical protein